MNYRPPERPHTPPRNSQGYRPPETPHTPPRQSQGNRRSTPPWYTPGGPFPWFGRNGRSPKIFSGVGNPQGIISQQQALTGNLVYAVLAGQVNGTMPATIGNILNASATTVVAAGTGSKFYNKWP
jgi:hypothetical protein